MDEDYRHVLDYLLEHKGQKFKSRFLATELNLNSKYIGQIMRRFKEEGRVHYERLSPKRSAHRWWIE